MGRAIDLVKRIEAKIEELQAVIPKMQAELGRGSAALSKRNLELGRLLDNIVLIEKITATGKEVDRKIFQEIEVSSGLLKKLNNDLETCRIALKTVMRDYGPALDLDPAEINGLIADKKKKQTAKDNSSKGLQKLETSWKNYCKVLTEAKYLFTGTRESVLKLAVAPFPALPPEVNNGLREIPEIYKNY